MGCRLAVQLFDKKPQRRQSRNVSHIIYGNNVIISLIEDPSGPSQVPNTQTENQPQLNGDSQPENATELEAKAGHGKKRKKKTSKAWDEFTIVTLRDGTKKVECKHCHSRLALQNTGSTSHLNRHMNSCSIRLASISGSGKPKQQDLRVCSCLPRTVLVHTMCLPRTVFVQSMDKNGAIQVLCSFNSSCFDGGRCIGEDSVCEMNPQNLIL